MRSLVIVTIISALLSTQGAYAQSGESVEARADSLISGGPRHWFGDSRAAIVAKFGRPVRTDSRVAFPDTPRAPDRLVTFHYNGASFVFYTASGLHDDFLTEVSVWDPQFLGPSPVTIGMAVAEVRRYVGDSSTGPTPHMLYSTTEALPDHLELWFREGRVVRLKWIYGVD